MAMGQVHDEGATAIVDHGERTLEEAQRDVPGTVRPPCPSIPFAIGARGRLHDQPSSGGSGGAPAASRNISW